MTDPPIDSGAPQSVHASGDRSIALGGSAIASLLVTGDNNTFFVGRWHRLADAYLNPRRLYAELDAEGFVGREWLASRVDAFISGNDRGYLIVEGDAGVGKSSFLAWLARSRGYTHHFVRLMPDAGDLAVAVRNISTQLIRAWELTEKAVGGVLPPNGDTPAFLDEVIDAAAQARDHVAPDEPIVIVVDGLDESVVPEGGNPLGLPVLLPRHVYLIASQRPVHVPLHVEVPRAVIEIVAGSEENRADVRAYLDLWVRKPAIAARFDAAGIRSDAVVATLLAKSEGIWVYLHYVCAEIASGTRPVDDLDALPVGLWRYYARYWFSWQEQHEARWPTLDLPLIATLSAAAEPVSAQWLGSLIDQPGARIEELLEGAWRPFISVVDQLDGAFENLTYQWHHASVTEFFSEAVSQQSLDTAHRLFGRRLARATHAAHGSIAEHYLASWGSVEAGLPTLRDAFETDSLNEHDCYGLRHLAGHLDVSGQRAMLHAVLAVSWPPAGSTSRPVNAWFAVQRRIDGVTAYRRDVLRAWTLAGDEAPQLAVVMQLRYALVLSSLTSIAAATPPQRWADLVGSGRLGAVEALAQVRELPASPERAEALTALIDVVPAALRNDVERDAIAAVAGVADGFWRVGELWRLTGLVSTQMRGDLITLVNTLTDAYYRAVARRLLGLGDEPEPLPVAGSEQEAADSPSGLAGSAEFVNAYVQRRQTAQRQLHSAGIGSDADVQIGVPAMEPGEVFWRTSSSLTAATEADAPVGDRRALIAAWLRLGIELADTAPDLVSAVVDPAQRAALLTGMGERGSVEVSDSLGALGTDTERVEILRAAAAAGADVGRLLQLCEAITDADLRARTWVVVAAGSDERSDVSARVLRLLEGRPPAERNAQLLTAALQSCTAEDVALAAGLVSGLSDPQQQSAARAVLVSRLCQLGDLPAARALAADVNGLPSGDAWSDICLATARSSAPPSEALDLLTRVPYASRQAQILAVVAHCLDRPAAASMVHRAADLIDAALSDRSRAAALSAVARVAPPELGAALLASAHAAAMSIADTHERALALLCVVASRVALDSSPDNCLHTLAESVSSIEVDEIKAEAIETLTAAAATADPRFVAGVTDLLGQMQDPSSRARVALSLVELAQRRDFADTAELGRRAEAVLREFRGRPRIELLGALPVLLAAAKRLVGNPQTVAAPVFVALADVTAWWP